MQGDMVGDVRTRFGQCLYPAVLVGDEKSRLETWRDGEEDDEETCSGEDAGKQKKKSMTVDEGARATMMVMDKRARLGLEGKLLRVAEESNTVYAGGSTMAVTFLFDGHGSVDGAWRRLQETLQVAVYTWKTGGGSTPMERNDEKETQEVARLVVLFRMVRPLSGILTETEVHKEAMDCLGLTEYGDDRLGVVLKGLLCASVEVIRLEDVMGIDNRWSEDMAVALSGCELAEYTPPGRSR
ncbi:hypothetical protein MAJ_11219, partial [Metarhizium majus ARSEF 297]